MRSWGLTVHFPECGTTLGDQPDEEIAGSETTTHSIAASKRFHVLNCDVCDGNPPGSKRSSPDLDRDPRLRDEENSSRAVTVSPRRSVLAIVLYGSLQCPKCLNIMKISDTLPPIHDFFAVARREDPASRGKTEIQPRFTDRSTERTPSRVLETIVRVTAPPVVRSVVGSIPFEGGTVEVHLEAVLR